MGYVALVQGATGAVGRELVAELVQSPSCTKLIAVTRREIPEATWSDAFPSMDASAAQSKLEIVPVDFEELHRDWKKIPAEFDAAFSTLGTTRKDAGSAEAFRKGRAIGSQILDKNFGN
jgi:oxidoreductase